MSWDAFYRDTLDALRGGADPNHQGEKGITLLHDIARHEGLPV